MYAVEFQAKIKNGTIEIPSEYRDKLKNMVRVIVWEEIEGKTGNLIDQLLDKPFRIQGFEPLSRDEIHARP